MPHTAPGCLQNYWPARGLAFIKRIETEDRYGGGRVIITEKCRDEIAKCQFIVVALGNYERCEDLDLCPRRHTRDGEHRHHLQLKDWVICRNRSWLASPDPEVYIVKVSDILGVFQEEENGAGSSDRGGCNDSGDRSLPAGPMATS